LLDCHLTPLWWSLVGHHGRVENTEEHWEALYGASPAHVVGWYEKYPATSVRLIEAHGSPSAAVVDVGGGAAALVDVLLGRGFPDLTVLDISGRALREVRERLGAAGASVQFVRQDVLSWSPERTFDVWHDRAVFHFLTDAADRQRYVNVASSVVVDGGVLVLATFAEDGPERCSGLPVSRYSAGTLAAAFPSFSLIASERVEHVTPSGVVQPFTYVVLAH
jgi:SAM-dependent methyltransferase